MFRGSPPPTGPKQRPCFFPPNSPLALGGERVKGGEREEREKYESEGEREREMGVRRREVGGETGGE